MKWAVPSDLKMATVTVFVNDGVNGSVSKSTRVPIRLRNSAPIIQELVVSERIHAVSGVVLQAVVDDENEDMLTYSWEVKKGYLIQRRSRPRRG